MKRDDVIEYSLGATHSEEEGRKIRRKIWVVTAILSVVTIAEVLLGVFAHSWGVNDVVLKFVFIGLTVVKAGYIVMVFMHLGDERKMFKYFILLPYGVFILYLLYLLFTEATSVAAASMSIFY